MEKIFEIIQQYPFVVWVILILAIIAIPLLIILAIMSFRQGREFSTPLFKFGPRVHSTDNSQEKGPIPRNFTENELDDIVERVRIRLIEYRNKKAITEATLMPNLPDLPKYTFELFKMNVRIFRKVREIVLSWGGGWAGSSIASFDTYFDLAIQHKLVNEVIIQDIRDFEWISKPGIYGDEISQEQFNDAAQLAGKIMMQLNEIIIGRLG